MKIGVCKIGKTVLDVVEDPFGVYRFKADPLVREVYKSGLSLNTLALKALEKKFPLESYLVFCAQSGYSVSGLRDVEDSMVDMNPDVFPDQPRLIGEIKKDRK